MLVNGFRQFQMLKGIFDNLRHGEEYGPHEISKASGDIHHFSRTGLLGRLVGLGVFSHSSRAYRFDRKRMYDVMDKEKLVVKVPFTWG